MYKNYDIILISYINKSSNYILSGGGELIINGKIVVIKEEGLSQKEKAVREISDGICRVADEHDWILDKSLIHRLAKEFVNKHYLAFDEKKNGNLMYPINRLEEWLLLKKHKNEDLIL